MSEKREFWINQFNEVPQRVFGIAHFNKNYALSDRQLKEVDPIHVIEYSAYSEALARIKKLEEALGFYENCTRLMIEVRDLPDDGFTKSMNIMDNGDRARLALKGKEGDAP